MYDLDEDNYFKYHGKDRRRIYHRLYYRKKRGYKLNEKKTKIMELLEERQKKDNDTDNVSNNFNDDDTDNVTDIVTDDMTDDLSENEKILCVKSKLRKLKIDYQTEIQLMFKDIEPNIEHILDTITNEELFNMFGQKVRSMAIEKLYQNYCL
jgi:NhaP-type Na+/H+ and K+/H+ antiporter